MRGSASGLLTYFRLQGKRILRLLPAILLVTAVLAGAVLLVGRSFFLSDAGSDSRKSVRIGIVGDYDDPMLSLALTALKNLDTSRFAVSLEPMEENAAVSNLRQGKLQAYIVIPEGFYDSVNYYRNDVQITYVSTDGAVGIGTVMINEIAQAVGALLLESENAVFGMQSYASDHFSDRFTPQEISDLGVQMTMRYGSAVFSRDALFRIHETGLADSLSFRGYYICAFILLFLLLSAIPFSPLHADRDDSLFRLLRLRGISLLAQVFAEYLAFAFTVLLFMLPALAAGGLLIGAAGLSVPEFGASTVREMLSLFPACVFAVLTVCGFQFLLYEVFSGAVPGILIQVLTALSAAYITGCFYPAGYFPEKMQAAAEFLPAGTARILLENRLLGISGGKAVLRALLWTLLCLLLAALTRRIRMKAASGLLFRAERRSEG